MISEILAIEQSALLVFTERPYLEIVQYNGYKWATNRYVENLEDYRMFIDNNNLL